MARKLCSIFGDAVKGLGYCSKHYQNFKYSGNPLPSRKYRNKLEDLQVKPFANFVAVCGIIEHQQR